MNWPAISIVTPSYNQGSFLEKTIQSVLEQEYPNLQYIVIDGDSDDSSVDIIRRYESHMDHWVSEQDTGQSDAINKGFRRANGDILGWLNSDDFLQPGALFEVARAFEQAPDNTGMIIGQATILDETGEEIYKTPGIEFDYERLLTWPEPQFLQPACFFTREAWSQCGPLREDLDYCMDLDLWLKIASKFKLVRNDNQLAVALSHEQAKTTNMLSNLHARQELSLLLYSYGATDFARQKSFELVDELAGLHVRMRSWSDGRVGWLVRGLYRCMPQRLKRLVNPRFAAYQKANKP
jgi:hypothetical protein